MGDPYLWPGGCGGLKEQLPPPITAPLSSPQRSVLGRMPSGTPRSGCRTRRAPSQAPVSGAGRQRPRKGQPALRVNIPSSAPPMVGEAQRPTGQTALAILLMAPSHGSPPSGAHPPRRAPRLATTPPPRKSDTPFCPAERECVPPRFCSAERCAIIVCAYPYVGAPPTCGCAPLSPTTLYYFRGAWPPQ